MGHKRSLSSAGTWAGADARASGNCCAAGGHQALPVPGGESQAGVAVVEQWLLARNAQVEERRTGGGAEEQQRTGGGEQRSGGAHAEEQSGGAQVEESRGAAARKRRSS